MAPTRGAAAALIRAARGYAYLNQAELARRAGLPRSVLNAYERGRREPGGDTLARVLAAAGMELRAVPVRGELDPERASRILSDVLDLAESFPPRRRGQLEYPQFARRAS